MIKIVTHPGSAHKDDFLSVCVLLSVLDRAEVHRREATRDDIVDPDTYLVDVGMHYDPPNHNFDHHQDSTLPCSFHLIMQHFGHHETAMRMFEWYSHMNSMDINGPHRTAENLGIETKVLFAASSPIDGYILALFSGLTVMDETHMLYGLMKDLGSDLLRIMRQKQERLEKLKDQAVIINVKHLKAIYSTIRDNPKLSMDRFLRHLDDPQIAISITPSVRGPGWELLRLGDHKLVDFRALTNHPEIRFVHYNGFVAKTRSLLPQDEVVALAARAVLDASSQRSDGPPARAKSIAE